MHRRNTFALAFLLLLLIPIAHANAPAPTYVITSQPTSIAANSNYVLSFNVSDSTNDTVNITVKFLVNSVNVENWTRTLANTTVGGNSYTATFNENLFVEGDTVRGNVTIVESSNSTQTNQTLTNSIVVGASTTALITSDQLSALPNLGQNIGDFTGNLAPGLFKFLLLLGLGVAIVGLIVAVIYLVKNKGTLQLRGK